ncbi:MAG: apolipoprotein N-acyltransferase [Candidatus Kryptoniota bacterium]
MLSSIRHNPEFRKELFLFCTTGFLLGVAFPPLKLGWVAFVSFIPALFALNSTKSYSDTFKLSYTGFLIFNIITIYWVGGWSKETDPFMMIGGAALVLGHPLFFTVPFLVYKFVKNHIGKYSTFLFPLIYIAYEHIHSITQIAFPWLTIGYSQSYNLREIQFSEYTGVLGVSLHILVVNVLTFLILMEFISQERVDLRRLFLTISLTIIVWIGPAIYGSFKIASAKLPPFDYKVAVIQPNIDPYAKWSGDPLQILQEYENQTESIADKHPSLVVWPETAIPFYILLPTFSYYRSQLNSFINSTNTSLITGVPLARYYPEDAMHRPSSHYDEMSRRYYDAYNGAALFEPGKGVSQTYGKIILVPFAERIPYADHFSFLIKPLEWGVGISNWAVGTDTTVFKTKTDVRFSVVICYESIFGDYVRKFVKKGAEFLVVITNDGWYGNTSGPYQHAAYAIFRAVENRRAVVRSANTGISEFIDPYGKFIGSPTVYNTRATILENIPLMKSLTFYSVHGDWIGWLADTITLVSLVIAIFIKLFYKKGV